ncbi:hypothetical protein MXL54_15000 [Enterobacteriaceae bacterium G50]|nr:hypothetical protein [Enterobacteriaceae bacterium G50]
MAKPQFTACCHRQPELSVCHANDLRENDMQKQPHMTEEAKAILTELSATPATAGEIAEHVHMSMARCQFILTQLVIAGLAFYQFGCYTRRQ